MTTRRGRPNHVRPRPPSSGRPKPRPRVTSPDPYRLRVPRGLDARRKVLPLPARLLLALAVVALGAAVLLTATGGIPKVVNLIGASFSGFIKSVSATPSPSPSVVVIDGAPTIAAPPEPYSNQPRVDLQVTLPPSVVGNATARLRIYLTLEGQEPAPIAEIPVSSTTRQIVPVDLTAGRNDFSATVLEAGVESASSPVVTFILDTEPPKVTIVSPKDGATLNADSVDVRGSTQPRTNLVARDEANGASVTAQAGTDGTFVLTLPLAPGPNGIAIHATDPAGNTSDTVLSVLQGSGKLSANLSASSYRISAAGLPAPIQLLVLVTDPDGNPLAGAQVTFSLTVPGIPPITKDAITAGDGRASFTTTLPAGVTAGSGLATVLVTTTDFGTTSDRSAITIIP